ncbi:uncharacterized protein [Magallana gigas]|uniref:uncharacterized protein n=1 Tax=Magallana gigas TaxID=29159 RepID=UPI0033425B46
MDRRIRTLTPRGQEMFQSNLDYYLNNLKKDWKEFERILTEFDDSIMDIKYLRKVESHLEMVKFEYRDSYESLISFLTRTCTEESDLELDNQMIRHQKCLSIMNNFDRQIQDLLIDAAEILSEKYETRSEASISNSIGKSYRSLKKVENPKTEKVRHQYVEKEREFHKQKALLEAKMELLEHQKKIDTLEAEIEELDIHSSRLSLPKQHPPGSYDSLGQIKREYTENYVREHSTIRGAMSDYVSFDKLDKMSDRDKEQSNKPDNPLPPQSIRKLREPVAASDHVVENLTQFLLKKDLLMSRFSSFNDKPDSYQTWKASFTNIVKELNISAFEEMDLLIKWLGPESKRFASSIRGSNINDPVKGLYRIWERLEDRYGRPEMIESALKDKLNRFPKISIKDPKMLYDLLDILTEIESAKENEQYATLLSYYDSSSGVNPIISKLPQGLQEKWVSQASKYKRYYCVPFPPFSFLVKFIRELSIVKNDPAFQTDGSLTLTTEKRTNEQKRTFPVHSRKTELATDDATQQERQPRCPIHKANHSLNHCRSFRAKSLQERKDLLREMDFCYKCCESKHLSRNCTATIKCELCGSSRHATALHIEQRNSEPKAAGRWDKEHFQANNNPRFADGGEKTGRKTEVSNKCTELCGTTFSGRSCAKVLPVRVYPSFNSEQAIKVYAVIDEQSNRTLARSQLFDFFNIQSESESYTLFSCSGQSTCSGRRVNGLVVEALDGSCHFNLPTVIECDEIPDNRGEIPTPEVAEKYFHLREIADHLMPLDSEINILLLIGRDLGDAHHILEQRIGPPNTPYAQKLQLGWVIVGEVCLGRTHRPDVVVANKVAVMSDGRTTLSAPCPTNITVKETLPKQIQCDEILKHPQRNEPIGQNIFQTSPDDDKPGLSVEDKEFLAIMDKEFCRDNSGQWVAPLPFREPRCKLPDNRQQALRRAMILDTNLRKNPVKCGHAVTFMKRILDAEHAELAPPLKKDEEFWFLPIFSVYHPKKPDQVRMVFDSSAQCNGVSLNNVLLSGPDLTNSLLGVLMRFRLDNIGVMADIQQMFHCFKVREDHRNYLRFFWYLDNDPQKQLVEYRMCVHVFGNSPSPAVATYGLRRTAENAESTYGSDVRSFVERNFYVDDGLISLPSTQEIVSLMKRTQQALLQEGGLRLHKFVSNSSDVMKYFPTDDLAKDLMSLDLSKDILPIQRSLGISWNLRSDAFTFRLSLDKKPYTRRGVLSCLNSFYDPLGFVAPVLIRGKLLLRKFTEESTDWDQHLPDQYQEEWEKWKEQLWYLENLEIPRTYLSVPTEKLLQKHVHVFTDASEEAIAAVAILRAEDQDGNFHQGFIVGKGKVAPKKAVTIPRLELCAAALGVEISQIIQHQLDIDPKDIHYHTDSKVVLGYIYNRTKRFYTYVSNRVQQIHKVSSPEQWSYVPSEHNPADQSTRPIAVENMKNSPWLCGPKRWFLESKDQGKTDISDHDKQMPQEYDLVDSENDREIRPTLIVKTLHVKEPSIGTERFTKYSTWSSLVSGIARLKHVARCWSGTKPCRGWHFCNKAKDVDLYLETEKHIIRAVQGESFREEIRSIRENRALNKKSSLVKLNPVLDHDGILRVGGRLMNLELEVTEKNPVIIPGKQHIATLLVRHYHQLTKHQGRHFTEGSIRSAGYWITGAKRIVSSMIYSCVTCRKMRRKPEHQFMADLPEDRLTPGPPFSSVGVDTFGPWEVLARRTRGGLAHAKRWAVMFSCLSSRAVHIEVIEEMSSSSFINALRRFVAIRGSVKEFRSDRGTNFVGSTESLGIDAINVEDRPVNKFLLDNRTVWIFNSPHSSHMGGAWERMIGLTRRILDSLLITGTAKKLTHETLVTFLAEASAIINSRPLVPVPTDPEYPFILTPYTLLTQKTDKGGEPPGPFDEKDAFKAQWKRVQLLADLFWKRWRKEYLVTLQSRQKWTQHQRNLSVGDVVLLKDSSAHRCDWKMAVVDQVFPSVSDKRVRKVQLRVNKNGVNTLYTRPVTETVLLMAI